jgi:hypothetical protein
VASQFGAIRSAAHRDGTAALRRGYADAVTFTLRRYRAKAARFFEEVPVRRQTSAVRPLVIETFLTLRSIVSSSM